MKPTSFAFRSLAPVAALLLLSSGLAGCEGCQTHLVAAGGHLVATAIVNGQEITPAKIEFNTVAIGTTTVVPVQLKNIGRAKVTVDSIELETPTNEVFIAQVLTTGCDDKPRETNQMEILGSTCAVFQVRYRPQAQQAMSNKILVKSNDAYNKTIEIPISGTGVGGTIRVCNVSVDDGSTLDTSCYPAPAMMPPAVEFADLAVGKTVIRTVRVFNDGQYDLKVSDAHIESDFLDFSLVGGSSLSPAVTPGTYTDFQVQFKPSVNGEETGSLIIPSNDVVNPSITIPLHGTAQGPELCITPNPIDFGTVPQYATRTLQLTLTNCGNADYDLTTLSLVNEDPASTVFTTPAAGDPHAIPQLPMAFPTGASITIDVTYKPIYIESPPAPGDKAFFSIKTDYQRATVDVLGRGGFPGCTEGGMNLTPTGVIVVKDGARVVNPANETFNPLTNITLDGSSSTAPSPERIAQYKWRLVSQPTGSVAHLITVPNTNNAKDTLYAEIVGDYVVELVVTTNDMCQSDPVTVTLHVVSRAAVHVQLTWPQAYGDVDLHYVGPGGTYYADSSSNLSDLDWTHSLATAYGTQTPTPTGQRLTDYWGLNNTCHPNGTTSDDATIDVDQRSGYGPENVTHNRPFDGTYTVAVHYYCNGSGTTVNPVVNIFVNGALAWHGQMNGMTKRQVWNAAQIVVSNNGTSINVVPLNQPLFTDTHGC